MFRGYQCRQFDRDIVASVSFSDHGKFMMSHRPFCYSTKEPGSSVIFIHFYTRDTQGSIEWR